MFGSAAGSLPLIPSIGTNGAVSTEAEAVGVIHRLAWRFPGQINPTAIIEASESIGLQFHGDQWRQLENEFEYLGILYPEQLAAATGIEIPMVSRAEVDASLGSLDTVQLAEQLVSAGAQFFGVHWCSVCAMQKRSLGSAASLLPYIELALPDGRPNQTAIEEQITAYPTWRFQGDFAVVESAFRAATRSLGGGYQPERVQHLDDGFQIAGLLQPEQLAAIANHLSPISTTPEGESVAAVSGNWPAVAEAEAIETFRNPLNTFDVNGDGSITAVDALQIINFLNLQAPGSSHPQTPPSGSFLDVSGDGLITALDALIVINQLNRDDRHPPFLIEAPASPLTSLSDKTISWSQAFIGPSGFTVGSTPLRDFFKPWRWCPKRVL